MRYPVVLFDLFGTLVHFTAEVPSVEVAGRTRRSTMHWLEDAVARELPGVGFAEFLQAVAAVTEEIVRGRPPEFAEVPSRERFARALARLSIAGSEATAAAERLSLVHMAHLAERTYTPDGHRELLREVGVGRTLALVSNFDHGATARSILGRDGLGDVFQVVAISEEVGRRKPHPAIFRDVLDRLGARPEEALHVGDSIEDDVVGARAAGISVAWIDGKGRGTPSSGAAPSYVLRALADLRQIV